MSIARLRLVQRMTEYPLNVIRHRFQISL